MKALRYVLWGLAALLVAVFAVLYAGGGRLDDKVMPVVDIGGPFRLASADGATIDPSVLAGKPFAVFFGFTHCPEVCPTTLFEMSKTLTELGPAAGDFRLYFITVDPERDTAAALKDYVANFDPRIVALVPTADELATVAKSYRVYFQKVPTSDGSYTMDHTATVYLMDREGKFHGTIAFGEAPENRLAKLKRLLEQG